MGSFDGVKCAIGVWNSESLEDKTLAHLHGGGALVVLMIHPTGMERAVHDEVGEVVVKGFALLAGLCDDHWQTDHEVGRQARQRLEGKVRMLVA